ncbi:hypothetical protein SeMB42_g03456 [Synchytrium endobioticum]|uniref:S1 motif domain-containing protein n=1 Tax=Synchytrium endobioticum TaxID=286115 RepID=A0A507D8J0_9FUNG|nr:hypothetical protein SeMB42_g03456 [Synchytrium endobioticum]TPX47741.1 hypothetical protein SeLEV6574_g02485 [Synchytrium endobioticum]
MQVKADPDTVLFPGDRICSTKDFLPGSGTFVADGVVYASVIGNKHISSPPIPTSPAQDGQQPVISVTRNKGRPTIPDVGHTVIGRVTRIRPQEAVVDITVVNGTPCAEGFQGIIRKQDIRAAEKDKVQVYRCFRPGDIISAEVVSMGDSKSHFLSTSSNDLGVIFATSIAGYTMVPISWEQMMCPVTKAKEYRKCAKPL